MSGFLLDTNIPSELIRARPDPRVCSWVYAQDEQFLYLSALAIGNLRPANSGADLSFFRPANGGLSWSIGLNPCLDNALLPRFQGRILPVTHSVADRWGVLDGQCQLKGTPLNTADGMIAATALDHDLTLVTRNMKDFAGLGVAIFNPWQEA